MNRLQGKHILAIDDAPSILHFLKVSMEALGAEFSQAQTAAYGLTLCEQLSPEVVILDLGLPDKEGLQILPRLKRTNKQSNLPIVIVLTVRNDVRFKEQAAALGADAYFTKPFHMETLVDAICEKLGIENKEPLSLLRPPLASA